MIVGDVKAMLSEQQLAMCWRRNRYKLQVGDVSWSPVGTQVESASALAAPVGVVGTLHLLATVGSEAGDALAMCWRSLCVGNSDWRCNIGDCWMLALMLVYRHTKKPK